MELAFREVTLLSVPVRILIAVLLSGIIVMDRGLKNRAAGFRTYMLVCIGSCVVMLTNQYIYQLTGSGDPVRMGAQVVSGIGFLGAGTIIVTSHSQIKGLTTAAGLWTSACLGLTIGIGFYEAAVVGAVAVFLTLTLLHAWESRMRRNTKVLTVYIELFPNTQLRDFIRDARKQEIVISNIQLESENIQAYQTICFLVTVKAKGTKKHDVLLNTIRNISCVSFLEEL